MENERKGLESLEVWKLAMQLGETVYKIVQRWEYFDKRGLGQQWTDSTDSVANNIAEGYGRYINCIEDQALKNPKRSKP